MKHFLLAAFILLFAACGNQAQDSQKSADSGLKSDFPGKYSSSQIREIHDLKYSHSTKKLLALLKDSSAQIRKEAALALATVGDSLSAPVLFKSFRKEKNAEAQEAMAFAFSQTVRVVNEASANALLSNSMNNRVKKQALITIGKYAPSYADIFIYRTLTENQLDTEIRIGAMQAFFEYYNRKYYSPKMIELAFYSCQRSYEVEVRRIASAYLSRISRERNVSFKKYESLLAGIIKLENDEISKANLALCLRKIGTQKRIEILQRLVQPQENYQVLFNALNATTNNDTVYKNIAPLVQPLLTHKSNHVQNAAAMYFRVNGVQDDAAKYLEWTESPSFWRAKVSMFAAAGRWSDEKLREKVLRKTKSTAVEKVNPYERSAYYRMLAEYVYNYPFILDRYKQEENKIAKDAALDAMGMLGTNYMIDTFSKYDVFDEQPINDYIYNELVENLKSKDANKCYLAAKWLQNKAYGVNNKWNDLSFLDEIIQRWSAPNHYEIRLEVIKLKRYCLGKSTDGFRIKPKVNSEILWSEIAKMKEGQKLKIETEKGDIIVELNLAEAPGACSHIHKLARTGFYDGLNFHRVIANFVIQGGDPQGNGIGSMEKILRTEIGFETFEAGSVGLASAGKDTEGCQFFINHINTPHLNSRYTVIGKVVEGMETVHKINVSDKIIKMYPLKTTRQ